MIELQKCVNKDQWDEFALENGAHPLQLWGWGQVKAAHGWTAVRIFAFDADKQDTIVSAAQILIRKLPLPFRSFAYIPRGPIGNSSFTPEFLTLLAQMIKRDFRSVALSVEPDTFEFDTPKGWVRSTNKILSADTIFLDIKRGESDLLAEMAKKTRQYIRKSAAEGMTIKQVRTKEELQACLEIYKETASRAKFNLHGDDYYFDVFNLLGEHSPVFAAYVDGKPVAFLWMAISADTAYELYGGMNDVGQQLRANYALKWHVMRKMKEWGLSGYDFGGLVVGGVSLFKQGWASNEASFAGTFEAPLSPFYPLWSKGLPKAKAIIRRVKR
jgi:peptidoglycan pentaglycine glycine transferase (the first glycine)